MAVKLTAGSKLMAFVKSARPSYRKHSVSICERNAVTLGDGYWYAGSRSDYTHHNLDGSSAGALRYPIAPAQFGGGVAPHFEIPVGTIVVKGGTSCGKESMLTLIGSQADIAALLS
jgi:hypothetical protein